MSAESESAGVTNKNFMNCQDERPNLPFWTGSQERKEVKSSPVEFSSGKRDREFEGCLKRATSEKL